MIINWSIILALCELDRLHLLPLHQGCFSPLHTRAVSVHRTPGLSQTITHQGRFSPSHTRAVSKHSKLAMELGDTQDCAIPVYFERIAAYQPGNTKSTDTLGIVPAPCCHTVVAATSILFCIEVYTRVSTATTTSLLTADSLA